MKFLILTLHGPMMSFGREKIDSRYVTRRYPGRSMSTGLLANALGWHHRDFDALERLQRRVCFVVRVDEPGELLRGYHTVDLGQPHMLEERAWTTRGCRAMRAGSSSTDTHLTTREYLVGASRTVVLWLEPEEHSPGVEVLYEALRRPARPLFLGRKCCVPSRPIVGSREASVVEAEGWREVLGEGTGRVLWREARRGELSEANVTIVCDDRDWANGVHVGQRYIVEETDV